MIPSLISHAKWWDVKFGKTSLFITSSLTAFQNWWWLLRLEIGNICQLLANTGRHLGSVLVHRSLYELSWNYGAGISERCFICDFVSLTLEVARPINLPCPRKWRSVTDIITPIITWIDINYWTLYIVGLVDDCHKTLATLRDSLHNSNWIICWSGWWKYLELK